MARKIADPWSPAGHAALVDQVGVLLVDPLAGLSVTVGPVTLSVEPLSAAALEHPVASSSPATAKPAARSRGVGRPSRSALRLGLFQFIDVTFMEVFISLPVADLLGPRVTVKARVDASRFRIQECR